MIDPERKAYIFNKLEYKPHSPQQAEIHNSDVRFRVLCCGRRYGKTTFGSNELTAAIVDPTEVGYYWIVGPKYTTAEKEFRIVYQNIIHKLAPYMPKGVKKQYNVTQGIMRIEMPWGTILEVKSAQHQDTLLGEGLHGVIMAEAARHTSDTWEQYVRPALSDKHGWAIFTSTPRGYNWFQGLWLLGQGGIHHNYESWRLPSWENPASYPGGRQDAEILDMEQHQSPAWFKQEIGAEFTAFTGQIYDEFDPNIHVKPIEYNPLWTNVWALDYGWANPFCCYDVMIDPEDNFYVWREYQVSQKTTFEHATLLPFREQPPNYHVDWAAGDPRGPDQANTIAIVANVPVHSEDLAQFPHEGWTLGVEYVKRLLKVRPTGKPGMVIDPSCVHLIRQIEQLRNPDEKEGTNSREGQHKHDDHGPDAIRYLVGQYFHNGAGSTLSDIYSPGQRNTEAATFFQHNQPLGRYGRF